MSNGLDRPVVTLGPGESFEIVVLPRLDAADRLARWLMHDADVAEDVVQEASRRALRYSEHLSVEMGAPGS
jgi:DNA-directed RNA polymerase specialized sigma24 family protein